MRYTTEYRVVDEVGQEVNMDAFAPNRPIRGFTIQSIEWNHRNIPSRMIITLLYDPHHRDLITQPLQSEGPPF